MFWKKNSQRLIGSYGIVLQQVIEDNELNITDNFTDDNNMPTNVRIRQFLIHYYLLIVWNWNSINNKRNWNELFQAKISFQVWYCGPESASQLSWSHTEDESQLIDIETQSLYPKSPKKQLITLKLLYKNAKQNKQLNKRENLSKIFLKIDSFI